MNDDFVLRELDDLLDKTEFKLDKLEQDYRDMEVISNDITDISNVMDKIKDYENSKNFISILNLIKKRNELIEKLREEKIRKELTPNELIRIFKDYVNLQEVIYETYEIKYENTPAKEINIEILIQLIKEKRFILEDLLIKLKFPIFEYILNLISLEEF